MPTPIGRSKTDSLQNVVILASVTRRGNIVLRDSCNLPANHAKITLTKKTTTDETLFLATNYSIGTSDDRFPSTQARSRSPRQNTTAIASASHYSAPSVHQLRQSFPNSPYRHFPRVSHTHRVALHLHKISTVCRCYTIR